MKRKTLKKLMDFPGVSGNENVISDLLYKKMKTLKLNVERDGLGSVWAIKKSKNSKAPTLLIEAHMDEVGFQVTSIQKNGLLKFEEHGYINKAIMSGLVLRVWSDDFTNSYIGAVITPDANTHHGQVKAVEIDKLQLDIGATNIEEVLEMGIKPGSSITFDTETVFQGDRVLGKAADNRAGVSILFEVLDAIAKKEYDYNLVVGSAVQEEVGLRGARTSAYKYKPDLAIVIDVSPALDKESEGILGKGTMLRHKDALNIMPKSATKYLRSIIKKNDIKYQDYFSKGGTNAGIIHISNEGCVVLPLGIVAKNLHSPIQVFDFNDYKETINLAKAIVEDLNAKKISNFSQF